VGRAILPAAGFQPAQADPGGKKIMSDSIRRVKGYFAYSEKR
jgi:hypothetical protein